VIFAYTGVNENNGDRKVRSTGTTQTLLETKLYSRRQQQQNKSVMLKAKVL
jgi:hypothetical protein